MLSALKMYYCIYLQGNIAFLRILNAKLVYCPVVKTLPSSGGSMGLILGWGAEIPQASQPKKQKQKTETILYQIQ